MNGPRSWSAGDRHVDEQRHRGCQVGAVQNHVLDDEVYLADQVVLLELGRPEVDLDGAQERPQTIAALGPAAWSTISGATRSSRTVSSPAFCRRNSSSTTALALRG
jgi:hypothetical protein